MLQQFMNPQQQQQNPGNPGFDLIALASALGTGGGRNFGDSLTQAAQIQQSQAHQQQQQYQQQQAQQQAMNKRQQLGQLAQLVQQGASPQQINQALLQSGLEPGELGQLAKLLTPDVADKFNPVTGELVRFQDGMAQGGAPYGGGMAQSSASTNSSQIAQNGFGATPKGQMEAHQSQLGEQKEVNRENREFLDKVSEEALSAAKRGERLNLLRGLAPTFTQGLGSDVSYFKNLALDPEKAANYEAFRANSNELVLELSRLEKGTQSNSDMLRLESTKPSTGNSEKGNIQIIDAMEAVNQRAQQYAEAADYALKNGLSKSEFKTKWARYAKDNPLFEGKTGLNINREHLNNWKEKLFGEKSEGKSTIPESNNKPDKTKLLEIIRTQYPDFVE